MALQTARLLLPRLIRADLWWIHKLPLAIGVGLAFAHRSGVSATELQLPLLLILVSGIATASFACAINDLFDIKLDAAVGKHTAVMELSSLQRKLWAALLYLMMFAVAYLLAPYPRSFLCFLGIWFGFSIYSFPLIRAKERGVFGILVSAISEHVLPSLLVASLIVETTSVTSVPPLWLLAVIAWSLLYGLRGILWHQLCDLASDREAGVKTFATQLGEKGCRMLAERVLFPLELVCFFVFLEQSGAWSLLMTLVVFLGIDLLHHSQFQAQVRIVAPAERFRFFLGEYYHIGIPLTFLLLLSSQSQTGLALLFLFVILFRRALTHSLSPLRSLLILLPRKWQRRAA